MKKIIYLFFITLILPINVIAADLTYDLGISASDISFSKTLIAGQVNRIYARIHNVGNEDVAGYVTFYQGDILIGDSQVVSVRAGGLADEVYVDWKVPVGSFNIRAEIRGQDPQDENSANDVALTSLFIPLDDSDGDGDPDETDPDDDNDNLPDEEEDIWGTDPLDNDSDDDGCTDGEDDFPLDPDLCADNDGDGIDNKKDDDDDNDGLDDNEESEQGTDPFNPDTDNDGTKDGEDDFPLDPEKDTKYVAPINDNNDEPIKEEEESEEDELETEDYIGIREDLPEIELYTDNGFKTTALINIDKENWNTYNFSPEIRGVVRSSLAYEWDFGDGTKSNQKIANHVYSQPGTYKVSLNILGKDNLQLSSNKNIHISFFNLENELLWIVFAGLFLFLFLLLLLLLSKREQAKSKKKKRKVI